MARYTGPVCKLCRREGEKLFLKENSGRYPGMFAVEAQALEAAGFDPDYVSIRRPGLEPPEAKDSDFVVLAAALLVPGVDLPLQLLAPLQQLAVARPKVANDRRQSLPDHVRIDAETGHRLLGDEGVQPERVGGQ